MLTRFLERKASCTSCLRIITFAAILCIGTGAIDDAAAADHTPAAKTTRTRESKDEPELRVCSQNLFRFGAERNGKRPSDKARAKQRSYLVSRMNDARCDIVAVQEVVGETQKEVQRILDELARELAARTGRTFLSYTGASLDPQIRNGFIVATDIGEVTKVKSFSHMSLPSLQPLGPPNFFKRAPMLLQLRLAQPLGRVKTLSVFNFHFKSKYEAWKDLAQTKFETVRLEEAEGVRRLAVKEMQQVGDEGVVILLGDRNSDAASASAAVLSGTRLLSDFTEAECRLTKELTAGCKGEERDGAFTPLFGSRRQSDPKRYRVGSYRFKGTFEIIDEILLPESAVPLARREDGSYRIGYKGRFYRGSDHLLLWAGLRAPKGGAGRKENRAEKR